MSQRVTHKDREIGQMTMKSTIDTKNLEKGMSQCNDSQVLANGLSSYEVNGRSDELKEQICPSVK